MLTKVLTTVVCCAAFALSAQNVTVVNKIRGEQADSISEDYVLSGVSEQTLRTYNYERSYANNESVLTEMISFALKAMIDKNYFVQNGVARVNYTPINFNNEGSAIVRNAIWINDLPFSDLFEGFSARVVSQAEELRNLNGTVLNSSSSGNNSSDLYQFQTKVFELKRTSINEAIKFVERNTSQPESTEDSPHPQLPIDDFEMVSKPDAEDGLADLLLDPDLFNDNPKNKSRRNRKNRNQFSEQVVELLEENNRILASYSGMFQSLQSQIDEINARDNSDLRRDMAEMREMIVDLRDNPATSSVDKEELDYLIFDKNDYSLSAVQRAMLNKYIVLLAKNPQKNVLVIGYADRSGNSEYNVWISEQRANSVKRFLERMGVDSNRIIVSYFGDTESTTSGPADRRVEVSLIN
ncbi:MAG: OmpA family protein [Bacteroidota bacterium]